RPPGPSRRGPGGFNPSSSSLCRRKRMLRFLPHRCCPWSLVLTLLLVTGGAAAVVLRWAPWEQPAPADEPNPVLDHYHSQWPALFEPPGNSKVQDKGPSLQ